MADFDVKGLNELNKKLQELSVKTGEKMLAQAGRQAMKSVLETAKQKANIDTGDLRSALAISTRKSKSKKAVLVNVGATRKRALKSQGGHILTGVNQKAIAQEFGTRQQEAEPFLRPALKNNVQRVLTVFKSELQKRIEKAIK